VRAQVTPIADAPKPEPQGGNSKGKGCQTKPMHLRVTAKGSFIGGLQVRDLCYFDKKLCNKVIRLLCPQVFAGDARTESMLQQLLKFFGPNPKNGLVLDGVLTCKQVGRLFPLQRIRPLPSSVCPSWGMVFI
jgi:hypothetical protein